MTALHEQCRPKCWNEVIGQDKAVKTIGRIRDNGGLGGHAIWLSGSSGTGKTTIARLAARDFSDDWVIEIDATGLTANDVESIADRIRTRPIGLERGRGWTVIINESHGLTKGTIRKLLTLLDPVPETALWIFTTTSDGQENLFGEQEDSHPLLSRCCVISLAQRGLAELFAKRAREVAVGNGLDGKPMEAYIRRVKERRNNLRAVYSDIESGVMLD